MTLAVAPAMTVETVPDTVLDTVLITGTTSGIGRALLEHHAARGSRVVAVNRRRVPELEAVFPSVHFACVDVRSREDVATLLSSLEQAGTLPDVFILNAGINRIDNDESFDLAAFREVLDTNLHGILNFVEPLTRLAPGAAVRHVIAISSMASYVGNPYGLGYQASKRALTRCFDVWSNMYRGTDLAFQQVMLGPVRTTMYNMAQRFPAWMAWGKNAFAVSAEKTARAIARLATTRKRKLFFPRRAVPLYLGMWVAQSVLSVFLLGRRTLSGLARRTPEARHDAGGRASG
jgi:NAD(P)-dependent dehydrogenase (short-subunit alcohol dehydrogenase family)